MRTEQGSRAAWLELARRQSQRLAEERVAQSLPLRWERLARKEPETNGRLFPRFAWALVLLPLIVLGVSTATLALVHHLQERQRSSKPPVAAKPRVIERAPRSQRPAISSHRETSEAAPPPAVERTKAPAQASLKRPPRKSVTSSSTGQPRSEEPSAATSSKPEHIEFGTSDAPDDGVIIVAPRAKLPPLWTPEDYKKNGRRDAVW